jgi:hypothetical protein
MKQYITNGIRPRGATILSVLQVQRSPIHWFTLFNKSGEINIQMPLAGGVTILLIVGVVFICCISGCDFFGGPEGPPIFADTKLINAEYTEGEFHFTMHENSSIYQDAQYIVLGIFNAPIETWEKSIQNMQNMEGGSASSYPGFTRGQVSIDKLLVYSDELQRFTGSPGDYVPHGTKYWAVWGFNSDWVIICSSAQITTDFE